MTPVESEIGTETGTLGAWPNREPSEPARSGLGSRGARNPSGDPIGATVNSVDIRPVEPSDQARAVSVQVMAFGSDPVMRWLYPDPHDYIQHYPRFVMAFGGPAFEHGTAYVGDEFGGVALWIPVGVYSDADAVEALFRETLAEPVQGEVFSILEQMDRYHIKDPHWYLSIIGVDPAHQGKGIGSALLRHSLEPCDEQGLPAYLESSNPANVPLFQRHGFEVLGEIQVGSSPPVFPMYRPPRA